MTTEKFQVFALPKLPLNQVVRQNDVWEKIPVMYIANEK